MEITIKNSWDEVTWNEYEQIEQILSTDIPDDYKAVHLVSILAGMPVDEVEKLPISAFNRILSKTSFLYTEPETHPHRFEYTVNGREYEFKGKLTEITTAQYLDYRAYVTEEDKDVTRLLSAFFIPKGHEYNDGYDMEQVLKDIGDMCWLDVRACGFFFRTQLAAFILILKSSLKRTMKKTTATKKQIQEMEESLNNMASYLLYAESVNSQILNSIK